MMQDEIDKELKAIKRDIYKAIFSIVLILGGLSMIFIFYGWKLGVATILIGWANNIAIDGLYRKK